MLSRNSTEHTLKVFYYTVPYYFTLQLDIVNLRQDLTRDELI